MDINWELIHARLAETRMAIEHGSTLTREETRKVLRARARKFAHEPGDLKQAEESVELLEFKLAFENYGIELPFIQEVQPLGMLTPLPGTPPFVLGIINLRGQVFSVLDLKMFFELPEKGLSDLNKVVIIRHGKMAFGVLADVIIGVRTITAGEIQPSLPTLTGIREKYLKGVTREQMALLDAERLLSDESLIVNDI